MVIGRTLAVEMVDQFTGIAWGGFLHGAGSGFDGVGQGEKGGLGRLRNGPEIAEGGGVDLGDIVVAQPQNLTSCTGVFFLLQGALIKIPDEAATVMFANGFADAAGQALLTGQEDTVFDVSENDEGAHRWGEEGMEVGVGGVHVLGKIFWFFEFPDVVVEAHGAAGSGVGGACGYGGGLGQVGDEDTVEVGAGSFESETAKKRMIEAGEFEPGEIGGAIEKRFEGGKNGADQQGREEAEACGGDGLGEKNLARDGQGDARKKDGG